jgi:hypothetical protein
MNRKRFEGRSGTARSSGSRPIRSVISPARPNGRRCRTRTMPRMRRRPLRCATLGSRFRTKRLRRGFGTYPGLPHRMERVAEKNGVLFVNDSKATNPTSTGAGAGGLSGGPLDPGRASQVGRSRRLRAVPRSCPSRLYDRRGGTDVRALLRSKVPVSECEMLFEAVNEAARRLGRARCPAVAGLRVVRPVPGLRGAGRCVPRGGGGVMMGVVAQLKIKARREPAGRSDRSERRGALVLGDRPGPAASSSRC